MSLLSPTLYKKKHLRLFFQAGFRHMTVMWEPCIHRWFSVFRRLSYSGGSSTTQVKTIRTRLDALFISCLPIAREWTPWVFIKRQKSPNHVTRLQPQHFLTLYRWECFSREKKKALLPSLPPSLLLPDPSRRGAGARLMSNSKITALAGNSDTYFVTVPVCVMSEPTFRIMWLSTRAKKKPKHYHVDYLRD